MVWTQQKHKKLRKSGKNKTEKLHKKDLHDPDNHDGVITDLEPAAVHGVAKSRTRLSDFTFAFHFHALEKEMATHSSVLAWRVQFNPTHLERQFLQTVQPRPPEYRD